MERGLPAHIALAFTWSLVSVSGTPRSFIQVRNITGRSSEACCNNKHLLSCQPASVDADLLASQDDILLTFKSTIPPNGFVYQSPAGDESVITLNKATGSVFGSFEETSTGRAFAIERCSNGHVWKEFDVNSLTKDDEGGENG